MLLVRHGETDWNRAGRIQGHTDVCLNELGHRQARALATALEDEVLDAIVSSDLQRAIQTAGPLARARELAIELDAGLRERCFGAYEGMDWTAIERQSASDAQRWRQREPDFAPGGGESLRQFSARVLGAVQRFCSDHAGQSVAVITHGGVLDCLFRAASRLDLQQGRTWVLGNASINRLLWTPEGFTLVGWGDVRHLEDI